MKKYILILILVIYPQILILAQTPVQSYINTINEHGINKIEGNIINSSNEKIFLDKLNSYRKSYGLEPLIYDYNLELASKLQVMYEYTIDECTHENIYLPEIEDRIALTSYGYIGTVVENTLFAGTISEDDLDELILKLYKSSKSHNEALLMDYVKKVGSFSIFINNELYNFLLMTN